MRSPLQLFLALALAWSAAHATAQSPQTTTPDSPSTPPATQPAHSDADTTHDLASQQAQRDVNALLAALEQPNTTPTAQAWVRGYNPPIVTTGYAWVDRYCTLGSDLMRYAAVESNNLRLWIGVVEPAVPEPCVSPSLHTGATCPFDLHH